jgi:RAQPRD family integrative conjugative element protein
MTERARATIRRPCTLARVFIVALAVGCGVCAPAIATDSAAETAHLAALLRQLDVLERLAQKSAQVSATEGTRYHFDYARLYADIARVRAGVEDYLSPSRAQPRDPNLLIGEYRDARDAVP